MSKLKAALITALVLGTTSAAMADTSMSFSGRANASFSWGAPTPVRTFRPVRPTPPPPPAKVRIRHRAPERFAHYNDRFSGYQDGYSVAPARSWTLLGTVNQVVNAGTPLEFFIGGYAPATQKIMLSSNGGKSRIFDVTIKFADGTQQLVHLDRYVGSRGTVDLPYSPTYTIELAGNRRVTSVVVDGLNANYSSYSVYAL